MINRKCLSIILILVLIFSVSFAQERNPIQIDKDIQLLPLGDSVYVHVSWHESKDYGRFSCNGLIVISQGKALMVDTPMDNDQTERLNHFIQDSLHANLTTFIPGHFHDDCLGGLSYLQSIGVKSIANTRTIQKCQELGLPIPDSSFQDSLIIDFHGKKVICRYFGAGHTKDNITVWLPEDKILFGGCLVKSMKARKLGNLSDAVVEDWAPTLQKVLDKYQDIRIVIPGHGNIGGKELLTHTIELARQTH